MVPAAHEKAALLVKSSVAVLLRVADSGGVFWNIDVGSFKFALVWETMYFLWPRP